MNSLLQLRDHKLFRLLYWVIRIGLAITFIISGVRKMPGVRFTALPVSNPVGNYFETMHQLGFYWHFIGYFQILVGILAFFNRTAPLSALLMMPVTVNIFLISIALHMKGTPFITAAMLAGNIFLLVWYYENFIRILQSPFMK